MKRQSLLVSNQTSRYTLLGIIFGFLFPLGATILQILDAGLPLTIANFGFVQRTDPLLWIIDTAPIFLGVFAAIAGVRQDNLLKANQELTQREKELNDTHTNLEELVTDRTVALEKRSAVLEKQTEQLRIISNVARAIVSVQDLDALLPNIARLVSEQFDFYHTGIFLVDRKNEYAILRAANSEGGKRMLQHQHRLKLDEHSIVGYAASRAEPRIALDVGTDTVYFNNPDLPNTRSEMALPLRIGQRVIGALDVQSVESNAFVEGDIAILGTLADLVAIAIENARLFSESQQALKESETTLSRYVRQEWGSFASRTKNTGYIFDGNQTLPLSSRGKPEKVRALAQTGRLSLKKATPEITVPIRLRGQTIGYLDIKSKKGDRQWTRDELTLLEAAAERAALALENARLIEAAQQRASREHTIGEISTKIGAVSNIESILQTAVEELGRKISGTTEVTLELNSRRADL